MIFEKQDYQQECIENIMSLLKDFDFKQAKESNLKQCFADFYKTHSLPVKNLSEKFNIDILMETGTGKTFTYLNLIFELHKNYEQSKFIIFVPRKAILESIKQNIKLTKDYFYNEYKKHLKTYFYNDTKSQSAIISHYIKNSDELSVLILTNSAIDKKDNILNKSSESLFNGKSIFENIIDLKPISIIDEPHLLKGKAFNEYFSKINNIYFRFGATFPKEKDFELSNVAYCLDSINAFNHYLVKQIRVHTITQDNQKPYLLSANTKDKFAIFSYFKSGIEQQAKIYKDQDLSKLDAKFKNISLVKITQDKAYLSNQETIQKKNAYALEEEEIERLLAKAIDLHFKKEETLFEQNIKALSLFFIPHINDFRGENPFIKTMFEKLYKQKREQILKKDLSKEYKAYLSKDFDESGNLRVCEGYFSGDKGNIDDKEAAGVKLILQEKEKLLSFETPLRFIFSVWALQEGWDNPNIFTLTKLAYSSSDTSRHQQVGRGLRICVNTEGKRITTKYLEVLKNQEKIDFFDINYLDMLISGEERSFIEGLQQEILESSFSLCNDILDESHLAQLGLNRNQLNDFVYHLKNIGVIEFIESDDKYKIKSPVDEVIKDNEKIKNLLGDKFDEILRYFTPSNNKHEQIKNANKPQEQIPIREDFAKKFKELWSNINAQATLVYKNIEQEKLINNIAKTFNQTSIEKEKIIYESKVYDTLTNQIITKDTQTLATKDYARNINKDIQTLLLDFSFQQQIPLRFLLDIYNQLNKENFINSPKKAFEILKELTKEKLHQNLLKAISYNFNQTIISNTPIFSDNDPLYYRDGTPRTYIQKYKLGKYIGQEEPAKNYLYDVLVFDSNIEKEVIIEENEKVEDKSIEVFAKLPKLSIPTPYKNYEPDFAYLLKGQNNQTLIFICETKGYNDERDIPESEAKKIDYAKVFFKNLQEHLKDKNITIVFNTRINKQTLFSSLQEALNKE